MPRIRTLKPEALQHRKVGRLSDRAFRLWVGMITQADDYGRLVADPEQLRMLVFGYQARTRAEHVATALEEIEATGLIRSYHVDGTWYAEFPSWADHQKVSNPGRPKLPEYQHCDNPRESSRVLANPIRGSEGIKDQGSEGNGSRSVATDRDASAPTPAAVTFQIPASVLEALQRAPRLGQVAKFRDPSWWRAELRANPGVDFASEILKAEAWIVSNPSRAPRKQAARFLHTWLARAERDE